MVQALAGDARAYRELLRDVGTLLRGYFSRRLGSGQTADAEDLVQDVLMALHTHRATYDTARPFTSWVHAIARYKLIDHYRQNRIRHTVPAEDAEALFAVDDSAAATARLDVDRLLDTVPAQTARMIRDVKIEGRSIAEVSEATGLSQSAVKVGVHRGIKALATRLQGKQR